MTVSNPIRFVDASNLDVPTQAEFDALESNFVVSFQTLPNIYAQLQHTHSQYAPVSHAHSYAAVSHAHTTGILDYPHGTPRFQALTTTNNANRSYVLTSDHRVKFLHWSNNSVFAIRVDATWFYLTHSASDERIKKNIQIKNSSEDLEACLTVFDRIQLIEFDWDTDASTVVPEGHVDLGFSAQNLASVKPEFVIQPTPEDTAQINVSALLPYLAGAIKGLQLEVESLKTEITALKAANA